MAERPLTDEQLADLERLEKEATMGLWSGLYGADYGSMSDVVSGEIVVSQRMVESDADFVIATRNALPSLLAEVRASRASPPPDPEARRLERAEVERLLNDYGRACRAAARYAARDFLNADESRQQSADSARAALLDYVCGGKEDADGR